MRRRSRSPYRQRHYSPSRPTSPKPHDHHPGSSRPYDEPVDLDDPYNHPRRRHHEQQHHSAPPVRRYDDRGPPGQRYGGDRRYDRDDHRGGRFQERDGHWDERPQRRYDDDRRPSSDRREPDRRGHGQGPVPSPPSRDIIFLGLDPELSENELAGFLSTELNARVESTKIVRDRATGVSKCFGFAQFPSLEEAQLFISSNFPNIVMPALHAHSEAKRVKIDFAGSRPELGAGSGDAPVQPTGKHDGTRDIGQPGGEQRVLLLRGLDPGTYAGEVARRLGEEISRMLGKGPQHGESCVSRVVMVVDRLSGLSWGFAFAEIVTTELAAALMPFLFMPQHQPNGFLVNGVPIAASFASPNAFIPTPAEGAKFLLRAAGNGGIGSATISSPDGEFCTYWHQQAGAVETVPRGAPPIPFGGLPVELSSDVIAYLGNLSGKGKKHKGEESAAQSKEAAGETDDPPADSGSLSMQPIKIGGMGPAKKKKKEEPAMVTIMAKSLLDDDDEMDLVGEDSELLSRTKGAHVIPPTSTSRKVLGNISKWNTKQTELAAPKAKKNPNGPPPGVSSANATEVVSGSGSVSATAVPSAAPAPLVPSAEEFDFSDTSNFATTGKVACLLCQRQFKSEDMLRKHYAQSDLHKARITFNLNRTNLADTTIREAGKRRKGLADAALHGTDKSQYRDRAAERREVHHLPDAPSIEPPRAKWAQPSQPPAPKRPREPTPPPVPAADTSNVGNQLLSKMGWSAGTGLGASGEGRVEPVKVQQFEERAGLGAAKGREAGSWSGPGGWQQRAKDMTQQRYDSSQ